MLEWLVCVGSELAQKRCDEFASTMSECEPGFTERLLSSHFKRRKFNQLACFQLTYAKLVSCVRPGASGGLSSHLDAICDLRVARRNLKGRRFLSVFSCASLSLAAGCTLTQTWKCAVTDNSERRRRRARRTAVAPSLPLRANGAPRTEQKSAEQCLSSHQAAEPPRHLY